MDSRPLETEALAFLIPLVVLEALVPLEPLVALDPLVMLPDLSDLALIPLSLAFMPLEALVVCELDALSDLEALACMDPSRRASG